MKFKLTQNVTNTFKLTLFRICITEMKLILIQLAINILFLLRYYISFASANQTRDDSDSGMKGRIIICCS